MFPEPISSITTLDRSRVIGALANIRHEWEVAVEDENLVDIQASVGLMLADVVMALELTSAEQILILGAELRREWLRVVVARNSNGSN
jgi:hypothetical protein